ncbi:MAG: TetR/AcrR family transcriptional regulator [Pseudonocardia sp.]|jgi:AcrR family transcriptional regulator
MPPESTLAASLLARVLDPEPDTDDLAERILDGALEQFRDTGLTRTTMDDVARRAGLSRVTIYRRFQNKNALIEAVLLRECRRCLEALDSAVTGLPGIRERMVEGFVFALRYAREHPLVGGLLRVEPQVILPFMTVHAEPALAAVRTFLALHLSRARDAGELADLGDLEPIAELMARIAVSFVISPYGCIPTATDDEARAFARRFLVPLIT